MTLDRSRTNGVNKADLLKAVQDYLARMVDADFDGNLVITARKGHLNTVKAFDRTAQSVFDPNEDVRQKRLLLEKVGK